MSDSSNTGHILVEVTVSVSTFDARQQAFVKAVEAEYKLSKADAGRALNDDWVHITIEPGNQPSYADAKVVVNTHLKAVVNELLKHR